MGKTWVALLLAMLLVSIQTIMSADDKPNKPDHSLLLTIDGGKVNVADSTGRHLQAIAYRGDPPDERTKDFFTEIVDMNFDGFPDVCILYSLGMQNIYYDFWLWRPETGTFVFNEALSQVGSPQIDPETKKIHSFVHISAASNVESEYSWVNGELVLMVEIMQEPAPDGSLVKRRSERGADGKMHQVKEEIIPSEDSDNMQSDADAESGQSSQQYDAAVLPNGEWWIRYDLSDKVLHLESRRTLPKEFSNSSVKNQILREWPQARDIAIAPFEEMSAKLTYPTIKAEFMTGGNEDSRQYVAAMVFTDDCSYWCVLETSADAKPPTIAEDENLDASVQSQMLKKYMTDILMEIDVTDTGIAKIPSSEIVPVYMPQNVALDDFGVMDALVRIKKIVSPDQSPWLDGSPCAYRYDGIGTVAGAPALLFSFGGDSKEKFTAERHFAVNAKGMVYELDVPAGPDAYWLWEDEPPSWWGEYADGEKVLSIGNYREGPMGMYFRYSFSQKEPVETDQVAAARGRVAYGEGIRFQITADNSTVLVSRDQDFDAKECLPCGRYVRR